MTRLELQTLLFMLVRESNPAMRAVKLYESKVFDGLEVARPRAISDTVANLRRGGLVTGDESQWKLTEEGKKLARALRPRLGRIIMEVPS